jgi:hypothetical protein
MCPKCVRVERRRAVVVREVEVRDPELERAADGRVDLAELALDDAVGGAEAVRCRRDGRPSPRAARADVPEPPADAGVDDLGERTKLTQTMRFATADERDTTMQYGVEEGAKGSFARVDTLLQRLLETG